MFPTYTPALLPRTPFETSIYCIGWPRNLLIANQTETRPDFETTHRCRRLPTRTYWNFLTIAIVYGLLTLPCWHARPSWSDPSNSLETAKIRRVQPMAAWTCRRQKLIKVFVHWPQKKAERKPSLKISFLAVQLKFVINKNNFSFDSLDGDYFISILPALHGDIKEAFRDSKV